MSRRPEAIATGEVDLGSPSTNTSGSPVVVISLATETRGGHFVHLHTTIGRATRSLGWRHVCAVDADVTTDIPGDWIRCLRHSHELKTPGVKPLIKERRFLHLVGLTLHAFRQSMEMGCSIRDLLLRVIRPEERAVVFVEWFNPFQLLAVWMGIVGARLRRRAPLRLACWILFAFPFHVPKLHMIAYKIIFALIDRVIGKDNLIILAGWDETASQCAAFFRRSITMAPLTCLWTGEEVGYQGQKRAAIVCWWPGIPAPRKGPGKILTVAALADQKSASELPIELHLAESLGAQSPANGVTLVTHEDRMPAADYVAKMNRTDIVLLPYESMPYANASSGIFMEAVMSGRIPLVISNTTMASELTRYGLERLIVDWTTPTFWRTVREIFADEEIRNRLAHMRRDYAQRFSDHSYGEHMCKLVESSTFR